MADISFVRHQMLEAKDPPASQSGVIKWLRENLFSGPLNSILTILALISVYYLIKGAMPWLLNGVWNANSLTECRQIIADSGAAEVGGAGPVKKLVEFSPEKKEVETLWTHFIEEQASA